MHRHERPRPRRRRRWHRRSDDRARCRRRGLRVTLVDQARAGAASRAAAGLLAPSIGDARSRRACRARRRTRVLPGFLDRCWRAHGDRRCRSIAPGSSSSQPPPRSSRSSPQGAVRRASGSTPLRWPRSSRHSPPIPAALLHPHDGAVDNVTLIDALDVAVARQSAHHARRPTRWPHSTPRQPRRVSLPRRHAATPASVCSSPTARGRGSIAGLPRPIPVRPVRGQTHRGSTAVPVRHVIHGATATSSRAGTASWSAPRASEVGLRRRDHPVGSTDLRAIAARAPSRRSRTRPSLRALGRPPPMATDGLPILGARPGRCRRSVYACGILPERHPARALGRRAAACPSCSAAAAGEPRRHSPWSDSAGLTGSDAQPSGNQLVRSNQLAALTCFCDHGYFPLRQRFAPLRVDACRRRYRSSGRAALRHPTDRPSGPWPKRCTRSWAATGAEPLPERKPSWLKVQGARRSELPAAEAADARPRPAHGLRGSALPQRRRVLGARHRDLHDPRRRLHAELRLLRRRPRPAAQVRLQPSRSASPRPSARCGSQHAVITSVDRDDLPDFGAWIFAETIRQIKQRAAGLLGRGARSRFPGQRGLDPRGARGASRTSTITTPRPCRASTRSAGPAAATSA